MEKTDKELAYGLEISEANKRLWVGEINNGIVVKTLYTDTWGGNRMAGTREKAIENAELIVKALNAFDGSVDAPYCHDLEQRIELLEMQLEEAQAKAAAYDRLMSGGKVSTEKEAANFYGRPVASVDREWKVFENLPKYDGYRWWDMESRAFPSGETVQFDIDAFEGDEETSLTLPDGWEEK